MKVYEGSTSCEPADAVKTGDLLKMCAPTLSSGIADRWVIALQGVATPVMKLEGWPAYLAGVARV